MRLSTTTILQVLNGVALAMEWYAPQVPQEWMKYFTPLHMLISAILHVYGGVKNPDGTPAQAPWIKGS